MWRKLSVRSAGSWQRRKWWRSWNCKLILVKTFTCVIIFRNCDQVYDESCSTKYPPKCSYTQECSTHYTRDCSAQKYGGKCVELPYEKCRKVKKCVRNPETRCRPVKRMECGMKKFLAPKKVGKVQREMATFMYMISGKTAKMSSLPPQPCRWGV